MAPGRTGSERYQHLARCERHPFMTRTWLNAATLAITLGNIWVSAQAPAFEVASIRENPGPWHVLRGYSSSGARLTLEAWSPVDLIMEAYGLKRYQALSALPVTAFYDIAAKAGGDGTPTRAEFMPMLQTLLADRFNLRFHRETREVPVYAMVVGKSGVKFKESPPEKPFRSYGGVNGRNQYRELSQATMEMVADRIAGEGIDRPVIDKTGLTGKYDIRLEATPEFRINNNPQPEDLRIFDAIQQQLGLKLEPRKAAIEVLVVDRLERPSAN
jgi:uncharacterized protein (TIGR03435 family)